MDDKQRCPPWKHSWERQPFSPFFCVSNPMGKPELEKRRKALLLPHSTASSSPPTSAHASTLISPSSPAPAIGAAQIPALSRAGEASGFLPVHVHAAGMVLAERALLAVAAALLAVLAGGLAVGSGGRWVTGGRWLLPIAALLAITGLLAIGALLPVAALLGVSALIVTAWLCGGIAGREKRWERWDDEAIPWQRAWSGSCWKAMQLEAVFSAVNHFKS